MFGNLPATLFVRVNTGATENAGIENARRSKSDTGKPETDTHYRIQRITKTYDTYFRSLPKTINSALRHQCRNVIQFKNNYYSKNDIFTVFALQVNRKASVTPHITFLVVIERLVSRIERHNRLCWTAFSSSFV